MFLNCCWADLSEQLRVREKLDPSPQESGTVSNQYTLLVLVHEVKTRVTSNHKVKCDTNIVWNASGGNIAKPGLTCAWASACCCAKWGARKVKWCMCHDWVHWNKEYRSLKCFFCGRLSYSFNTSSEEDFETTSQHQNSIWGAQGHRPHHSLVILLLGCWHHWSFSCICHWPEQATCNEALLQVACSGQWHMQLKLQCYII